MGADRRLTPKFSRKVTGMPGAEEWNKIKNVKSNIQTKQNKMFKTAQCMVQINFWVVGLSGK